MRRVSDGYLAARPPRPRVLMWTAVRTQAQGSRSASAGVTGLAFGFMQQATISGVIFNDADGSGTKGAGEAGISGRNVFLYTGSNPSPTQVTTDGQGGFTFGAQDIGTTYRVCAAGADGQAQTYPKSTTHGQRDRASARRRRTRAGASPSRRAGAPASASVRSPRSPGSASSRSASRDTRCSWRRRTTRASRRSSSSTRTRTRRAAASPACSRWQGKGRTRWSRRSRGRSLRTGSSSTSSTTTSSRT